MRRASTMPEPRVAILTFGSRGDVQPFVALARAMSRLGARPVVGAHPAHRGLVEGSGVEFSPLAGDPLEWMRSQAQLRAMVRRPRVVGEVQRFAQRWTPVVREMLDQSLRLAESSDAVVFSHGALAGPHLAEGLGKPAAFASLQPWDATGDYPSVTMRQAPRQPGPARRAFNRESHWLGEQVVWFPWRSTVNRWRRERLGLPGVPFLSTPWSGLSPSVARVYGYSPHVAVPPADWPPDRFVSGWWTLPHPETWRPPPDLADFLNAGPPPIYVGFGSHLPAGDVRNVDSAVDAVAKRLGVRLVVAAGWSGLGSGGAGSSERFTLSEAPHDWLFPRMRAVVHHGGAGTTGAAVHAGVPQVVVPAFFDQYFWSVRVIEAGVGQRVASPDFSAAALETALAAALEPGVARRATALADLVRSDPGADGAAERILHHFRTRG